MADNVKFPMIREDGMYVGVDGSVKDPAAACPKMEQILARKQEKLARKNAAKRRMEPERGAAIMNEIDYDAERYSLCIVHASQGGMKTYYKFYRVADLFPEEDAEELVPAIVQEHVTSLEEAQFNPDHLYNPSAAYYYDSRDSDFYLFQWRLDPGDFGKQLTRSYYDDNALLEYKEPREVFFPAGVRNEGDLRRALSDGISFEGRTTSVFYVVYSRDTNGVYQAVRCERGDFLFVDGLMRLRSSLANPRESALSAPKVLLDSCDIIESPHSDTSYRCVYAKLGETETTGSVLLRPLDYYAADYVKWFIGNESIQATKAERRRLGQIIDAALSRPDALETYLEAKVPEEEIEELKDAVAATVAGESDEITALFVDALLRDAAFHRRCVDQAARESDDALEAKKREIAKAEARIEELERSANNLSVQASEMEEKRDRAKSEAEGLANEIAEISEGRERILEELHSDIALKLGLQAAASSRTATTQTVSHEAGYEVEASASSERPFEILANNMKALGVVSVFGDSSEERARASQGILGALAATKLLAIPQPVARQIADALSIALKGRTADKITVPADCRSTSEVVRMARASEGVVLVENVIDSVNEGVLFALMAEETTPVIVLPFVSHASANLVAKEAWSKVFLTNAESLAAYPRLKAGRLQRFTGKYEPVNVSLDDSIDAAKEINANLQDLKLPAQTLLLTATILVAVDEISADGPVEPFVSQHLLMASELNADCIKALAEWSPDDEGLAELATRLVGHGV